MKVVLFCGGLGMRMRPLSPDKPGMWANVSDDVPKPMVHIGAQRPLMWHVMKYYAHYGHKEFILCLGYKAEVVKDFFLHYNEYLNNDFILEDGGRTLHLKANDMGDWKIHFVDTGLYANVGERLSAVRSFLGDDEMFYANYSDGLSDLPLDTYTEKFLKTDKVAGFVCVRPPQTCHVVSSDQDGTVRRIEHIRQGGVRINGGYFVLRREIFDYMNEGEELVSEPFSRLIEAEKLFGYNYDGFWTCIDTFKEKQELDEMWARGNTPWQVWRTDADSRGAM